jgi:membrane protease YdiL (CAAX protease family)
MRSTNRILWFGCLLSLFGLLSNSIHSLFSFLFYATAFLAPWLNKKNEHRDRLRETLRITPKGWLAAFVLCILYVLGPTVFLWAVSHWYLQALFLNPGIDVFLKVLFKGFLAFLPIAVAEEFFFRGYVQETLLMSRYRDRRIGPLYYRNVVTSCIFALIHVISRLSLMEILTFFTAMIFGRLVIESRRSIWPAVGVHAFMNAGKDWVVLLYQTNIPLL